VDFAEALAALEDSVVFHKSEAVDIPQAYDMVVFAAGVLGLQCPPELPPMRIDKNIPDKVAGNFFSSISAITLRRYNGGRFDQGIVVHELAHWIQQFNSVPFCEEQAERVRHAWLNR